MKTEMKSSIQVVDPVASGDGISNQLTRLAQSVTGRLAKLDLLALSTGLIFLWFGALKFFPEVSPAEVLAQETIRRLTFGLIVPEVSIILLALMETAIGLALILSIRKRRIALIAIGHMLCTFTPLLFFPDEIFVNVPFQLTLTGQYIVKNLIIVSVLLTLLSGRKTGVKS